MYFYDMNSAGEHCTFYQIRNLINQTNVTKTAKHSFNACDDFLGIVMTAHILSASLKAFKMETLKDQPSEDVIATPDIVWILPTHERKALLECLSKEEFIHHLFNSYSSPSSDSVHDYTKYLMSIGCMYLLFKDTIKEGDGKKVLQCYCYLLPVFIISGHRNYANESINLLWQYYFDLPPRKLIWSRFINTAGVRGEEHSC